MSKEPYPVNGLNQECNLDCKQCGIRKQTIFAELSPAELDRFVRLRTLTHYEKKQRIFYQGEPCLGLYLVCTGKVKLTKATRFGHGQIVGILSVGGLLGAKDLFTGERHSVTAIALENTRICFMKREDFSGFLQTCSEVALGLIGVLCRELAASEVRIEALTFKTARRRLAELLLELSKEYGRSVEGGTSLSIKLTREELAEMIGVSQETAIRLLSGLRQKGLIRDQDGSLVILDDQRLKMITR